MTIGSIGIVLHDFALGGTERIAVRLAGAWAARGTATTLFCGSEQGPLRAMLGGAVRVVAAGSPIGRGRGETARLGRVAAAYFARAPVEAVFVPGNTHWPVVPHLAALPASVRPVIVAQVSAALRKPQRGTLRQALYDRRMRRLLAGADGLVTLSGAAESQTRAIVPGPLVRTIPTPALDDAAPPPTRAAGRLVMAAGRLVPEKGFATLIEAFARLDDPAATLTIVGAGPDEARLRALGSEFGIGERLALPGYQSNIRPWLDRARLFVLSSDYEGYPAVLVEALAAGRPVVATDCTPATGEVLADTASGRVVPVGDARAMAAAIRLVLDAAPPEPATLAGRVARHRLGVVADAYLDLLEPLRNGRRTRSAK